LGQNLSVEPSSFRMPPADGSYQQQVTQHQFQSRVSGNSLQSHNSLGQNLSVEPSSFHMPPADSSYQQQVTQNQLHPPVSGRSHMQGYQTMSSTGRYMGNSLQSHNSLDQNLSIEPSSIRMPPAKGSYQQQIGQDQFQYEIHRQPESAESYHMQQSRVTSQEHSMQQPLSLEQQERLSLHKGHSLQGAAAAAALKRRTPQNQNYTSIQHRDNVPELTDENQGKKVFILHTISENNPHIDALRLFAAALRERGINVSIDLFETDKTKDNWSIWYEKEILSSKVVLCIITPDFYSSITENDRIKGYVVYNLMSDPSKDIAFRAVFLDTPKNMDYIPLSMRGATHYCISSNNLNVPENDEFTNLYAFLTGQNRVEKPKLGKMIVLAPKKSRCKFILYVCG